MTVETLLCVLIGTLVVVSFLYFRNEDSSFHELRMAITKINDLNNLYFAAFEKRLKTLETTKPELVMSFSKPLQISLIHRDAALRKKSEKILENLKKVNRLNSDSVTTHNTTLLDRAGITNGHN
jgi:hypothetical protein